MEKTNLKKANLLYDAIDQSDGFYIGHAEKPARSMMNVTFTIKDSELEKRFAEEAIDAELSGLKGHRSVGGIRASIYNAMPVEGVKALVSFMEDFSAKNG